LFFVPLLLPLASFVIINIHVHEPFSSIFFFPKLSLHFSFTFLFGMPYFLAFASMALFLLNSFFSSKPLEFRFLGVITLPLIMSLIFLTFSLFNLLFMLFIVASKLSNTTLLAFFNGYLFWLFFFWINSSVFMFIAMLYIPVTSQRSWFTSMSGLPKSFRILEFTVCLCLVPFISVTLLVVYFKSLFFYFRRLVPFVTFASILLFLKDFFFRLSQRFCDAWLLFRSFYLRFFWWELLLLWVFLSVLLLLKLSWLDYVLISLVLIITFCFY
jgi:hypothetical protein